MSAETVRTQALAVRSQESLDAAERAMAWYLSNARAEVSVVWDELAEALEAALPLLIRLGDFIGNGEPDRVGYPAGSLADRCAVIGMARDALSKAGRTAMATYKGKCNS